MKTEEKSVAKTQISGDNVKLFLGGLDPSVTQHEVIEYFSKFGKLAEGVVMLDKNGESKGFGFVTFNSSQAVQKCLKSRPHFLHGKGVDVKISTSLYRRDPELTEDQEVSQKWLSAERLLMPVEGGKVWSHDQEGEKHRIRFCTSEDITFTGIGLRVKTPIRKLVFNICEESGHCKGQYSGAYSDHRPLFREDFENLSASSSDGSVVLKLRHGVKLSCERIYLLVLTLHGGASLVGTGGQEFVSVRRSGGEEEVLFKFENYKHKTDKPGQTTTVEQGLVEKIFFNL